ncbi:MAG: SusC/RagA family TonB-linked outer membrane protein [Gemmatimonadetes bacterium]|nr:SusC/RagA family TonB-linked outer membrane protein [Gemmatimonadota bacterium]
MLFRLHRWRSVLATLTLIPVALSAQERRVTGTITRQGVGTPLDGAEVAVIGPTRGQTVRSDAEGRYAIQVPAGEVRLQVRLIGYKRVEFTLPAGQATADFNLAQDIFKLNEVVVSGQATTIERRSATTSVSLVTADELKRVPVPTVEASLTGKITGVNLQSNSGAPGGGIQMQIRGNNTVLGGFDPLYVVDGVIYSNAVVPGGRGFTNNAANAALEADAVNRLADLNPNDIASIEVLKGASASSIYGSKAANGVVVITTTRGQSGAPRFNVTQRVGRFDPLRLMQHRRWTQDSAVARYGAGVAQYFAGNSSPFFDNPAAIYSNRDPSYETVVDVSGGNANTKYFISGNWKNDEGIELNTGAGKQGLRVNVDQTFGSTVDFRVSSVFNRNTNQRGWNNNCNNYGCHGYALTYIPSFINLAARNPDGTFNPVGIGPAGNSNTLFLSEIGVNDEETNRFTGGASFGWTPNIGGGQTLRLVAGGGIDAFDQRNNVWSPNDLFHERVQALPGESVESGGRSKFFNYNLNAIHTGTFFGLNLTTSAGFQYEDRQLNTFSIRTQNLLPGQRNVNQGTNITATENLTQERTIAAYASEEVRLLNERLLVRGGVRAERSSVMGDVDQYYVFPNVSSSYRFENVFGPGSDVKLRAAYGETGNQPLFGQKFTNLLTPQLGGQQGIAVSTLAGFPGVEPERLKEIEGGAEGSLFNERFTWELTYFNRNTTNLLLNRVPEPSSGFATQVFNGGKIRNWGYEAGIGFTPIQTGTMTWVSRTTFTHYDSKVEDLAGLPPFFPAASGFGNLGRTRVEKGKQITAIVGFDFDAQGNRAAAISQLGNSAPDFRMGFSNDLSWKRFSLNTVVDWQQGGSVINLTEYLQDDGRTSEDWGSPAWAKRYDGYLKGVIAPYIEDASFVKVREISVNYDLPQSVYGRLNGVKNARIGFAARNAFMFAGYRGLDPEVANFGSAAIRNNLDITPYPPSRNLLLNISLGF